MSLRTPDKLKRLQELLYAKAKQEPGYRFYALYDKVHREDILAHAYRLSRAHRGAPGVDGQSFEDIESYGVERWLGELREELRTERYKPQAVRRVMIPKPGGVGERPLGIPCIRDRVAQTAAKLILEPIFEANFDDAAYGYRPGRSATDAVERVHQALRTGHTQVVDADLSKYFDTIPHSELLQSLSLRICDKKILRLLKMWLKAPVAHGHSGSGYRLSGGKKSTRGTPQGGIVSPLMSLVYMHRYIKAFRKHALDKRYGAVLVNYADDFVVLCHHGAPQVLETTQRWMNRIGLSLNLEKTSVRDGRHESFDFLGHTFKPMYSPRTGGRYLGVEPSKKAVHRLREKIRHQLRPSQLAPWQEIRDQLNSTLRGWANYFSFGSISKTRHHVDLYVYDRVRSFLRRRSNMTSLGTRTYSRQKVFGELGVLSVSKLPRRGFANALA